MIAPITVANTTNITLSYPPKLTLRQMFFYKVLFQLMTTTKV